MRVYIFHANGNIQQLAEGLLERLSPDTPYPEEWVLHADLRMGDKGPILVRLRKVDYEQGEIWYDEVPLEAPDTGRQRDA